MEVSERADIIDKYRVRVVEPDVFRVLGPDGEVDEEAMSWGAKLSEGETIKLYRYMVLARALDRYTLMLHRMGKVRSTYGPHEGHEAADAGTVYALEDADWIAPYYRNLTLVLIRGVPLERIFAKFFANSGDVDMGRNLTIEWGGFREWRILSIGAPIGHQYIYAVGFAYALRYRGSNEVVAAYLGDGGSSTDGFFNGLNYAAVFGLPVVFHVYNNQYAISVPVTRQASLKRLATRAAGFGVEGLAVDGMDLFAVYKASKYAVERARKGSPVLIEHLVYRFQPHTTADDPQMRYRDPHEAEYWRSLDPIPRLEKYMAKYGILSESDIKNIWGEAEEEVRAAAKAAEAYPDVGPEKLVEHVYSELTWNLKEQLEEVLGSL